jgi:dTDP-D-glucose 4,6-dehydratase
MFFSLAQGEEVLMCAQIQNLRNDIANLLEVIRRLREEHRWDTTGLTFTEVTTDDIFGTRSPILG